MASHLWSNTASQAIPLTRSQHLPQIKPQRDSETRCRFRYVLFTVLQRAYWYYWGKDAKLQTLTRQKFTCVLINAGGNFQLMNVIYHLFSSGLIWFWMKLVEKLLPNSLAAKSGHRWKVTEFLTNFKSTGKQAGKDKIISDCQLKESEIPLKVTCLIKTCLVKTKLQTWVAYILYDLAHQG